MQDLGGGRGDSRQPRAGASGLRQDRASTPGRRAIAELSGKRPATVRTTGRAFKKIASREQDVPPDRFPPYWTAMFDDLMRAFKEVCAYSCFRIHPVTGGGSVDHFAAKSRDWRQIYEWSNYRLVCARLNARKRDFGDVLDPFLVGRGWFQLELLGFQVIPNRRLPKPQRDAVLGTIGRLGLNEFRQEREKDAQRYWDGDVSLRILREESPFVAQELRRLGRLNKGDRW